MFGYGRRFLPEISRVEVFRDSVAFEEVGGSLAGEKTVGAQRRLGTAVLDLGGSEEMTVVRPELGKD